MGRETVGKEREGLTIKLIAVAVKRISERVKKGATIYLITKTVAPFLASHLDVCWL